MYKFEYRKNGKYCVRFDENVRRTIRRIERKGGTVIAISRCEEESYDIRKARGDFQQRVCVY